MCSSGVLRLYVSSNDLLSAEVDCEDNFLLKDARDEVDLPFSHTSLLLVKRGDDVV